MGAPSVLAVKKSLDHIDPHARAFIGRSPFLILSTADADGWPDASPRGDAPGFVVVEDPHTLLIPDRHGNNDGYPRTLKGAFHVPAVWLTQMGRYQLGGVAASIIALPTIPRAAPRTVSPLLGMGSA